MPSLNVFVELKEEVRCAEVWIGHPASDEVGLGRFTWGTVTERWYMGDSLVDTIKKQFGLDLFPFLEQPRMEELSWEKLDDAIAAVSGIIRVHLYNQEKA